MSDATRVVGTAECPRCFRTVELVEDGDYEESTIGAEVEWSGCATGQCCGLLIADWWEGTFVYDLNAPPEAVTEEET